jgi:hypothetical protein
VEDGYGVGQTASRVAEHRRGAFSHEIVSASIYKNWLLAFGIWHLAYALHCIVFVF